MPETIPVPVPIRKIQILANRATDHPLFYCHSADEGHEPCLLLSRDGDMVRIRARRMVYKVKLNPQTKNRVDVYMSLDQAGLFVQVLYRISSTAVESVLTDSKVSPGANAIGNMRLPAIHWTRSVRLIRTAARIDTGTEFSVRTNGSMYIDLESPDESHIKMTETEVHIGMDLSAPSGQHDIGRAYPVQVPEHELQRGRNEKNPIMKTSGDFFAELTSSDALGLAKALVSVLDKP